MSQTFPTLEELPESLCYSAQAEQEHVPHIIYAGTSSIPDRPVPRRRHVRDRGHATGGPVLGVRVMNMAAGAIAPPEWVYVGAPVLLLTVADVTGSVQAVRNAEVMSIAPKSCLVQFKVDGTLMEQRIPLNSLITAARGDTRPVRLELVEVKSERGTMAMRLRDLWRARTAAVRQARWAAEHPNHQEAVDSAVRALGTWQAILASAELDILTEKLEAPPKSWPPRD